MKNILTREEIKEALNESQELSEKLDYFDPQERMKIVESFINQSEEALNEISLGGVKNVLNYGQDKFRDALDAGGKKVINTVNNITNKVQNVQSNIETSIKDVKDAYYTGNIQELEDKLLDIVIQSVNKINEKRKKMGEPPISPKSVLTSISNKASKKIK